MNKKYTISVLTGLVAITIVAGSIMTSSMAYAAGDKNGKPFEALWDAINDIQIQIDNIGLVDSSVYRVNVTETAQPGERFDIEARCDYGDALLGNYLLFNTFPVGYSGGSGPVMDQNPGNANREIQVGWKLNLNNRDGVTTNSIVDGEVSILCIRSP